MRSSNRARARPSQPRSRRPPERRTRTSNRDPNRLPPRCAGRASTMTSQIRPRWTKPARVIERPVRRNDRASTAYLIRDSGATGPQRPLAPHREVRMYGCNRSRFVTPGACSSRVEVSRFASSAELAWPMPQLPRHRPCTSVWLACRVKGPLRRPAAALDSITIAPGSEGPQLHDNFPLREEGVHV